MVLNTNIFFVNIIFLILTLIHCGNLGSAEQQEPKLREQQGSCGELIEKTRDEGILFSAVLACELGFKDGQEAFAGPAAIANFPLKNPGPPSADVITASDIPKTSFFTPNQPLADNPGNPEGAPENPGTPPDTSPKPAGFISGGVVIFKP